jgi:hypothetical protein
MRRGSRSGGRRCGRSARAWCGRRRAPLATVWGVGAPACTARARVWPVRVCVGGCEARPTPCPPCLRLSPPLRPLPPPGAHLHQAGPARGWGVCVWGGGRGAAGCGVRVWRVGQWGAVGGMHAAASWQRARPSGFWYDTCGGVDGVVRVCVWGGCAPHPWPHPWPAVPAPWHAVPAPGAHLHQAGRAGHGLGRLVGALGHLVQRALLLGPVLNNGREKGGKGCKYKLQGG